ncbi:pentapeptide repeat-containing protein, partial [Frankia sp. CiP3]|uniref:pentapeptide repeat-containing protein n=1 Tax=Frankia sp. CiP3 TaxID=2880971 RepID=UPI00272E23A9
GADLSGAQLDRAALVDARLDGANLTSAALVDARLDGASLIGAQLDRANLEGAQWSTGTRWPDSGWARRMWDASEEVSAGVFQVRPDPGWERADFPPFV